MDKLKSILTLVAVIVVALAVIAAIGFLYIALQYVLLIGIICLAAVLAMRFLTKPSTPQIDAPDTSRELRKIDRTLDEYRRKLK